MNRTSRIRRVSGALAISLILALGAAAAAQANSIVYLKNGNVWLSTPDAAHGYQLTFDGGWDSPSEADNGTIMAVKNGESYRFSPSGQALGPPVPTLFHGADPSTNIGPAGVRVSPDAAKQAYWGTSYTSYEDYSCGCVMFRWEAYTRWGASDQFNEPNQTKGQQLYGEPAWIDNNTVMVTDVGSLFGDEVATLTVGGGGGGDNSLTQWFSDPDKSVSELQFGTVSRQGDKLAFVASTQASQDQIRFYAATGPIPAPPTPMCVVTGAAGGRFSYTSFAPDGTQIAWQESDGVHVGTVGALSDCGSITDQLVVPGGTQPSFGSADVNMANAPTAPASGGPGNVGATGNAGGSGQTHHQGHRHPRRRHPHPRRHRHGGHARRVRAAAMAIRPTA